MTSALLEQLSNGHATPMDVIKRRVIPVKFDWFDEETFPSAFASVSANKFCEYAAKRGVRRFMLLSAGVVGKGRPMMGLTHAYLEKLAGRYIGSKESFHYVVLTPSWFHQNFLAVADEIKQKGEILYKAVAGREDAGTEIFITGPELFNCDEAASLLSAVLGRRITHKYLIRLEMVQRGVESSLEEEYTEWLVDLSSLGQWQGVSRSVSLSEKDLIEYLIRGR
ncbi:hypothetical protein D9758_011864 [Tetrapyrgos nigripes]|uniref:NmrA-like domain-containing protein n=1 Tax=Tetrapyrgos nigripes TaxID=182062 RepID=A0A8H5CQ12_9AGAR|nr:hypothetical protein D9758_011864 [Tetrapyrgos nigripes]